MGEGAGLEGVLLASVPTMPVPLIKARGQKCRMTENKNHCLAAIPGSGEWPGNALQDDTIPDTVGRVGGEGTGDSTNGGVLQVLGGRVGKVLVTTNRPRLPSKTSNHNRSQGTPFCDFFPVKLFLLEMPFVSLSNANQHFYNYQLSFIQAIRWLYDL